MVEGMRGGSDGETGKTHEYLGNFSEEDPISGFEREYLRAAEFNFVDLAQRGSSSCG